MRRGCAPAEVDPELSTCLSSSGNNGNYHTKRCYEACDFDKQVACNDDNEIFKNFNSGGVKSCKTCSSHIFDPAEESDCAKGEVSLECPDFANAACFSSRVTTTVKNIIFNNIYKNEIRILDNTVRTLITAAQPLG